MQNTPLRSLGRVTVVGCLIGGLTAIGLPMAANADETPDAPKNIIVLISDGAGYNQFDIANQFETGTSQNQITVDPATGAISHEASVDTQVYDNWPVQVGQSHFSANGRAYYAPEDAWGSFDWVADGATDSAAAGTALGTGVKTNNGTLGYDADANRLLTLGEQAMEVGKKVGLVTDVPFNHATPAGFIAHNQSRNDYHGLATEMIDSGVDVIIGGGHPNYTDANTSRSSHYGSGSWISQADFDRLSTGQTEFDFIESKAQFEQVAAGENVPDKLFGLARVAETFQYNRPGLDNNGVLPYSDKANSDVPSLATAADAALNVLENDEEGFFLMIEGGAVDWAGHANQTTRLIEEQQSFNQAAEAVDAWVQENSSWDETLVIVTADHETGYLMGAGAGPEVGWTPMAGEAGQLPEVTWHSGGHTNALVPLFAKGAGADVLAGRADQWDSVRGAYLDNTDVGEVVFDFLGHSFENPEGAGIEATVQQSTAEGALSMTVSGVGESTLLSGAGSELVGQLPAVSVSDTRNEVQAQGKGWTLSGSASAFTAGNREFGAEALTWTPKIVDSENGASAGPAATLGAPAALADSTRTSRVGTTVVSADLNLAVPAEAKNGNYGSEIVLSLFAKD
ncbi:alkaline phosphatase [Microbacterium sp. NPDC089695]|uniref:alkaline phosphatase n=1 Tax=Microbacterium sp. NPDC089695 TaxID=3364198 RepID=UPI0037F1954C